MTKSAEILSKFKRNNYHQTVVTHIKNLQLVTLCSFNKILRSYTHLHKKMQIFTDGYQNTGICWHYYLIYPN